MPTKARREKPSAPQRKRVGYVVRKAGYGGLDYAPRLMTQEEFLRIAAHFWDGSCFANSYDELVVRICREDGRGTGQTGR